MAGGKSRSRVLSALSNQCWAITPAGFEQVCGAVYRWERGEILSREAKDAKIGAVRRATPPPIPPTAAGKIVGIDVFGPITQRAGIVEDISNATSCESLVSQIKAAAADPHCSGIALNFSTPGGSVFGLVEASELIYGLRGIKPVWGIANSECCSAGIWLLSQCERAYGAPLGNVGGIGVITSFEAAVDDAKEKGTKTYYVSAPKGGFKAEDRGPMTPELEAILQKRVDDTLVPFEAHVARGRTTSRSKVSPADVRSTYGAGRTMSSEDATAAGMLDGVRTWSDMTDEMMGRSAKASRSTVAVPRGAPAAAKKGKTMADENEGGSPPVTMEALAELFAKQHTATLAAMNATMKAGEEAQAKRFSDLAADNAETKRILAETQAQTALATKSSGFRMELQALKAAGKVADGEIEAELQELLALPDALASAKLQRMKAGGVRIPTRAAFMVTGSAGKQMPVTNLLPHVKPEEEMVDTSQAALTDLAAYGEICAEAGISTDTTVPLTPIQKSLLSQRLSERGAFSRFLTRTN